MPVLNEATSEKQVSHAAIRLGLILFMFVILFIFKQSL